MIRTIFRMRIRIACELAVVAAAPLGAVLLLSETARAQDFSPAKYIGRAGSATRTDKQEATMAPLPFSIPVITGAPFAAEQDSERHQILADGTHIDQSAEPTKMWRDSTGRTRVEAPVMLYPPRPVQGFPNIIVIFDPTTSSQYVLDPEKRVAHRILVKTQDVPPIDTKQLGEQIQDAANSVAPATERVHVEQLGFQQMEGLLCFGKRTTIASDPSSDRKEDIVVETWYSVDLQIEVSYKTPDRGSSDNVRVLRNVLRSEPDAGLFRVPAGYTVVEETGRFQITMTKR